MLDFLRSEGISENIISQIEKFRAEYPAGDKAAYRVPVPKYMYRAPERYAAYLDGYIEKYIA